jgi:cell division protein FtsL
MPSIDIVQLAGQLGVSGIFLIGVVYIARRYFDHLEAEVAQQRTMIDHQWERIIALETALTKSGITVPTKAENAR